MTSTDRLPYCGGTDAAAIVCSARGVAYYRSSWEVWAERHAPEAVPPRAPAERNWLDLGNAMEAHVLDRYRRELVGEGLAVHPGIMVRGPEPYGWMRGQLDSTVYEGDRMVGLVDAKTSRRRSHWFDTDDEGNRIESQPAGYAVQVRWYMGLARLAGHPVAFADLCALDLMSASVDVRTLPHDEGEWAAILAIVLPWWERHIIGGERPADDHSEACRRWWLYCLPREKSSRVADPDEAQVIADWLDARAEVERADERRRLREVELLAALDTERLTMGPEKSSPYVQVQAAGKGGRCLRAYRFGRE